MLIYFGYSFCPDVCPTTLARDGRRRWTRLGVDAEPRSCPIFITIDPERDTPKVLTKYMKAFGPQLCRPDRQRRQQITEVEKEYPRLCQEAAAGQAAATAWTIPA